MILAGGLVVEGTLVVEAGTQIHADGPVVLTSTMQLEVVLATPDTLEEGTVQVIACTSPTLLCVSVLRSGLSVVISTFARNCI